MPQEHCQQIQKHAGAQPNVVENRRKRAMVTGDSLSSELGMKLLPPTSGQHPTTQNPAWGTYILALPQWAIRP